MGKIKNIDILPIEEWLSSFEYPLIIAGSCSAESEEQVLNLALALDKINNVRIFRAGIWKPRTSPHSFQGYGEKALMWLQKVKKTTNLLTAAEVLLPEHVDLCLKNEVDIIWIGARTTVNPYYVQNICKALKGTNIPVLIKNPINPDIKLWAGAIERLNIAGIKKIVAVHRGFHTYEKTPYRNNPIWEIPIELKRIMPNLPIICDPSHISGKRSFIADLSQKAFDINMCGLMIEVHENPNKAISDAHQQITPKALSSLLKKIVCRKETGDESFVKNLEQLRTEIDNIDVELLNLLKKRMDIVEKIALHKKNNNITAYQVKRWSAIIKERTNTANKLGLNNDFIIKMLKLVHDESILLQHIIMNNKPKK